jgi:hypothetical protein
MQARLQTSDGDDMVKVMGCDDVNSVQVACLFFQHRFVVGVNAGAFALKAFNPVGELLSIFPNGVAKGDDFQLVRLCLVVKIPAMVKSPKTIPKKNGRNALYPVKPPYRTMTAFANQPSKIISQNCSIAQPRQTIQPTG